MLICLHQNVHDLVWIYHAIFPVDFGWTPSVTPSTCRYKVAITFKWMVLKGVERSCIPSALHPEVRTHSAGTERKQAEKQGQTEASLNYLTLCTHHSFREAAPGLAAAHVFIRN